jgi:hypothetical protein
MGGLNHGFVRCGLQIAQRNIMRFRHRDLPPRGGPGIELVHGWPLLHGLLDQRGRWGERSRPSAEGGQEDLVALKEWGITGYLAPGRARNGEADVSVAGGRQRCR